MKKIMERAFCLAFLFLAFGCRKNETNVAEVPGPEKKAEAQELPDEKVDLDLTSLSSTMIYAEIFNMVVEPEKYDGKKIRMKGLAALFHDDERNRDSYACIVKDATACCAQGIDFALSDAAASSSGYPKDGDEITLTGTFREIMEGDISHYMITEAEWR